MDPISYPPEQSRYLSGRGRWRENKAVDKRVYHLQRNALGDSHPHTLRAPRTIRLLERNNSSKISLTSFDDDNDIPPYAILSHRWDRKEVLFKDIVDGTGKGKPGYHKIKFYTDQA
jgi:hypothetical protein